MKFNLQLIEKMVEAGASGGVVLAYLRDQHQRWEQRKSKDRARKASGKKLKTCGTVRNGAENASREAILEDTPRARLFREGKGVLLTLGIADRRAGALIAQWLKLTNDDEQLVLAAILKAQTLGAADPPGWILETLKGKVDGKRSSRGRRQSAGADFFAGLADVAKDIGGNRDVAGPAAEAVPRGRVNIDG